MDLMDLSNRKVFSESIDGFARNELVVECARDTVVDISFEENIMIAPCRKF
jgi:hypothetical protein